MEKKAFNLLGFGLAAMVAATTAAQYVLSMICSPSFVQSDVYTYLSVTMLYFFGLPTLWLFIRKLPVCGQEPKKPLGFGRWFLWLLYALGVTYIFNIIGNILMALVSLLRGSVVPNTVGELLSGGNLLWNLLIVCICSPIVEEVIFRKLLLDRLKPFGDKIAILYTALAFGLFHMNFYQFFYAFAIGMIFAYLTIQTGSIRASVLLHMLINFFGSVVSVGIVQSGSLLLTMLLGMLVIGLMTFALVWTIVKRKSLVLQGPRFSFSRPVNGSLILLTPGSILFILVCGVFFVLYTFFV